MTAEAVWRDLHCHTLLKSNLSPGFPLSLSLSLRVYGEVSELKQGWFSLRTLKSIFSL